MRRRAALHQIKNPEKGFNKGHTLEDPHHGIVDLYWKGKVYLGDR